MTGSAVRTVRRALGASVARVSLATMLLLSGCGRYGSPLPPEAFSPASVKDLTVRADLDGVIFAWQAPDSNLRGDELENIGGYRIYRLAKEPDAKPSTDDEYELIATIYDRHLEELRRLREQARKEGRHVRKVRIDPALKQFQYEDTTVEPGLVYFYQVVPFNQGNVKGQPSQTARVLFRGESSDVRLLGRSEDPIDFGTVPAIQ